MTAEMSGALGVDLDSDPLAITATRVLDAPRDLVFRVWTDPGHLAKWWGPNGFTTTTSTIEPRAGGGWHFVMHGPDGTDYENHILYDEVVLPERLSYRHGGGGKTEAISFRVSVHFEDLGGRTRLTMTTVFASAGERDRLIREVGAAQGLAETLGRLAVHVAAEAVGTGDGPMARRLTLTRLLPAPPERVWRAWTEPAEIARWWGPRDFTAAVVEADVRPGGTFRIVMRGPDGVEFPVVGTYREVVAPERLVCTNDPLGEDGRPLATGETVVTLTGEGGGTRLVLETVARVLPGFEWMMEGMDQGWAETIDKMAAAVAGR